MTLKEKKNIRVKINIYYINNTYERKCAYRVFKKDYK